MARLAFCFNLKLKITLFYLLSLVFIRFITRCNSLSLIVIFCYSLSFVATRCHSLLFVVTRCHSLNHSLSFVIPSVVIHYTIRWHSLSLVVIRCCSLYHSLSFVVTLCTTLCLSFYKRSIKTYELVFYEQKFDSC